MSVKKENKILTYEQARELKFFCSSVVGTRQEFYELLDDINCFKAKLDRMHKTCEVIEKYLGEEIKPLFDKYKLEPESEEK